MACICITLVQIGIHPHDATLKCIPTTKHYCINKIKMSAVIFPGQNLYANRHKNPNRQNVCGGKQAYIEHDKKCH